MFFFGKRRLHRKYIYNTHAYIEQVINNVACQSNVSSGGGCRTTTTTTTSLLFMRAEARACIYLLCCVASCRKHVLRKTEKKKFGQSHHYIQKNRPRTNTTHNWIKLDMHQKNKEKKTKKSSHNYQMDYFYF